MVTKSYIYVYANIPTAGIMVIVETTEHSYLHILLNLTNCSTIIIDYSGSVLRVLSYLVNVTGLPLDKSPSYVWNSTESSQINSETTGEANTNWCMCFSQ